MGAAARLGVDHHRFQGVCSQERNSFPLSVLLEPQDDLLIALLTVQ